MNISRHAEARLQQRGISSAKIDVVWRYGAIVACGYLMRRKDIKRVSSRDKTMAKHLQALDGLLLVVEGETLVTAYFADREKQKRLLRGSRH